jgi:hypothetical protein
VVSRGHVPIANDAPLGCVNDGGRKNVCWFEFSFTIGFIADCGGGNAPANWELTPVKSDIVYVFYFRFFVSITHAQTK